MHDIRSECCSSCLGHNYTKVNYTTTTLQRFTTTQLTSSFVFLWRFIKMHTTYKLYIPYLYFIYTFLILHGKVRFVFTRAKKFRLILVFLFQSSACAVVVTFFFEAYILFYTKDRDIHALC